MIGSGEIEVRTDDKGLLICTEIPKEDGVQIVGRKGKKEDKISIEQFLKKIYGQEMMITPKDKNRVKVS